MMFSERSAPSRAAAELRQVRCSLNTPVVSIEKLPVGPATAAIALHETSGDGSPYFTVAVRCERTRGVVFFAVNDEVGPLPRTLAGDAALFLAESMGFLFDDWVVAGNPATREAANRLWGEFVEAAESRPVELSPPNSQGRAPTEIRADDTTPAIQLTKFRGALPWSTRESAETATPPRDSTRPAGWLAGLFSQLARPRSG